MKPLFDDVTVAPAPSFTDVRPAPVAPSLNVASSSQVPVVAAPALTPVPELILPTVNESEIARLGEQACAGLGSISTRLLDNVKVADTADFGKSLNELVLTAKGIDPAQLKNKGFLGKIFGAAANAKERLVSQYNSVEKQMGALVIELDKKSLLHQGRIGDFEQLYNANYAYHQQLEVAANQGEAKLVEMRAAYELASQQPTSDSFAAQKLADFQRLLDRLEKRVDDLRRAMLLSKQMAPQIRMMQENARAIVQKFGDVKTVTLPAWKNTFSLYVLHLEQKNTVALLNSVDDATEDALKKGADLLRENTSDIARARQRSVVSVETLEHVQRQLLGSIDDVRAIDEEARQNRRNAQPRLQELERELISRFAPGQR